MHIICILRFWYVYNYINIYISIYIWSPFSSVVYPCSSLLCIDLSWKGRNLFRKCVMTSCIQQTGLGCPNGLGRVLVSDKHFSTVQSYLTVSLRWTLPWCMHVSWFTKCRILLLAALVRTNAKLPTYSNGSSLHGFELQTVPLTYRGPGLHLLQYSAILMLKLFLMLWSFKGLGATISSSYSI